MQIDLNERQLGSLILSLQNAFQYRDDIKELGKQHGIAHLNNIDDECKLLLILTKHLENK